MGGIDEEASAVSTGSELQSKTSLAGKMEFFSESSECSSSEADDDIFGASSPDKDLAVRAETTTAPAVAPTHPPGSSSSAANVAVASSPEVGTNSAPTSGASTLQPAASAYTLELDALPTLYSGIPSEIPAEFMDAADAFSQSLPSPSKSVAARRPVATVFGSDAPAEAVGASAQDEGDADDEFDYDTKDDAAMPQFHQHSYRPAAPPAHIVTDLRSMPLGALKEEEEEEEENAAEPAAELQSGGPKGHTQDAAAGDLPAAGQLPGGDTAADQTTATAAAAQDAADARQLPGRFQPAPPGSPRLETRLSVGTPLELESPKHHRAFRTVTSRYRRPVDGSPSSHDGSPQLQSAEEGLAAGAPHEEFRGELVLKDVDLDVTDMEEGGSSGSPKKGAKARRKASQTSKAEEENAEGMASPKLTRKTSKSKGGGGSSPKLGKKASSARRKELIKELLQNMKDVHSTFAQAEAIPELKAEDVVEVAEVKIAPPPKPATKAPAAAAASPPPTAAAASENRRSMDPPHPSPRAQAAVDTGAAAADDSLDMEEEWERANEVAASSWMEEPMTPRSMLYGETIHYFMTMDLTHLIPSIDEERWQPPKLLDILLCRGPVPLQQALHLQRRQLMCLAKQPLNDSHPRHVQTLLTVFSSYTGIPLEELKRYGDHWSEFGFQGRDPATDLRAGGMLSLLQLYALRIHNPDNADAIYALSRDPRQEFPMAPVGVNITTWTLAAMRQGLLSREANRRQSMVETSTLFYVGCFYELHARWKARNHTMADSGHVLEALEKYCLSHTSAVIHRAVSNSLH